MSSPFRLVAIDLALDLGPLAKDPIWAPPEAMLQDFSLCSKPWADAGSSARGRRSRKEELAADSAIEPQGQGKVKFRQRHG